MSPPECDAITDVMPTISKLWHQRVRWMRGGLENLHTYGRTDVTKHYIRRQLSILFSITSFFTYIAAVTSTLLIVGHIDFALAWIPLTVLFIIDRAVVVKKAGPLAIFVSMLMIPEIIYDIFQQIIYLVATIKAIRGTEAEWKET
jgi:cellulose synthase/poly-beta-1,6-N-acetylglucosamine synthase-like glycosyltransferase